MGGGDNPNRTSLLQMVVFELAETVVASGQLCGVCRDQERLQVRARDPTTLIENKGQAGLFTWWKVVKEWHYSCLAGARQRTTVNSLRLAQIVFII